MLSPKVGYTLAIHRPRPDQARLQSSRQHQGHDAVRRPPPPVHALVVTRFRGSAATAPWHMWNEASIVVRRNGFPRRASNPGLAECILVEKQTLRPIRPKVCSSSVYGPVTATVDSTSECLMEAVSLLRLRTPESILAASPRKRLVSSQVAGVERPPADRNPANSPQPRHKCQNDSSVSPAPARPVLANGNLARRRSSTAAQLPVVTAAACRSLRRGVLRADFSPTLPFLLEQSRCSGRSDY